MSKHIRVGGAIGLAALLMVWTAMPLFARQPETPGWLPIGYHEEHPVLAYWYGMGGGDLRVAAQRAQGAGIDGFIVMNTSLLGSALEAVRGSDFRITVHLHPPHSVGSFYKYISDPNLVTYRGRPVMFTWQARVTEPDTWRGLRDQYDPDHNHIWRADGDKFDILQNDAFDGISPYAFAWSNAPATHLQSWASRSRSNGPGKLFVPPVSPGCDLPPERIQDGRDPCVQDRRDGAYYASTWNAALATRPEWAIVVSTWDEEAEGTGVSPRPEWGDLYLDLTREFAATFSGGEALDHS